MAGKQAVTITTMHTCPKSTALIPHVGGPITGPGCPGVRINGVPVSVQGDMCVCSAGGPDSIIEGCPGVQINGTPLTLQGSMTAHGGTIPMGEAGVLISSNTSSVFSMAKDREPVIYNLQWLRENTIIRNSKPLKMVTLRADTRNIADGETATITIYRNNNGEPEEVTKLDGIVKNNQVEVEWEVEEVEEENENIEIPPEEEKGFDGTAVESPSIEKVYWTDKNAKEVEYVDSNKDVDLVIETKKINPDSKLVLTIEEINGNNISKQGPTIGQIVKHTGGDVLIIKKAFKFDKGKGIPREVKLTVTDESNSCRKEAEVILREIKEGAIIGIRNSDISTFIADIKNVLHDSKFADFNKRLDAVNNRIKMIYPSCYKEVESIGLDPDEKRYIEIIYSTINSNNEFWIEYLGLEDLISDTGSERIRKRGEEVKDEFIKLLKEFNGALVKHRGGAFCIPIGKGNSHSFILTPNKNRTVNSNHELFGHGIPIAKKVSEKQNNDNAVRMDNLVRRLLSMEKWDGAGHTNEAADDPYGLPMTY